MRCILINTETGEFIGLDGKPCAEFPDAQKFKSWGKASDFNQNLGPEWQIEELPE